MATRQTQGFLVIDWINEYNPLPGHLSVYDKINKNMNCTKLGWVSNEQNIFQINETFLHHSAYYNNNLESKDLKRVKSQRKCIFSSLLNVVKLSDCFCFFRKYFRKYIRKYIGSTFFGSTSAAALWNLVSIILGFSIWFL